MAAPLRILCAVCGPFFPEAQSKHGDFEAMIAQGLAENGGAPGGMKVGVDVVLSSINIREGDQLPSDEALLNNFDAVIFSGSVPDVDDSPFVRDAVAWINKHITPSSPLASPLNETDEERVSLSPTAGYTGIPILGLCYGHQLLAHALPGGKVGSLPEAEFGTHVGQLTPHAAADPLWDRVTTPLGPEIAKQDSFEFHCCHRQSVLTLPTGGGCNLGTYTGRAASLSSFRSFSVWYTISSRVYRYFSSRCGRMSSTGTRLHPNGKKPRCDQRRYRSVSFPFFLFSF